MSLHQFDNNLKLDNEYLKGEIDFLIKNNKCRLLDGRRTEGYIENVFVDSGMFRWRITKYENAGDYWDLGFEDIYRFQFNKNSIRMGKKEAEILGKIAEKFDKSNNIMIDKIKREETYKKIESRKTQIKEWLNKNISNSKDIFIDFKNEKGSSKISELLKKYLSEKNLYDLEKKTAERIVLNPNSGEWFKGMVIVMAELGLTNYCGKIPRTQNIFNGIGRKDLREKYIINRIAFVNAIFELNSINEVILYRGMCSELEWENKNRAILHMTFSKYVAEEFSDLNFESKYKTSYIIKAPIKIQNLFMTFVETEQMNEKYLEKEAIVIGNLVFSI